MGNAKAISAIYGGGPFYEGGWEVIDKLKESGFNTVILWTIHVHRNGNLYYNDKLLVENGKYVGKPEWKEQLASLKTGNTSVKRIEIGVGSWGVRDFETIKELMDKYGTGSESILYKNFKVLKEITGVDAVNYDDESQYSVKTMVDFGRMLDKLGMKVALCPYCMDSVWKNVKEQLGEIVDLVYLQCYAGGSGNSPKRWNEALDAKVIPGLWCTQGIGATPVGVFETLKKWNNEVGIGGGFIWLYDDLMKLGNTAHKDYANSINLAVISDKIMPIDKLCPVEKLNSLGDDFAKNRNVSFEKNNEKFGQKNLEILPPVI